MVVQCICWQVQETFAQDDTVAAQDDTVAL